MSVSASSGALRQQPAFVQFWIARIASGFGFQMLSVAVGWQIYAMTGRALDLGLIGLAQFIPSVLFALPAGHIADQFERRRVVVLCQILEWIAIALLTTGSFFGVLDETRILALVFVISIAKAFEFPPMQAMVPGLVPERLLPQAMAASASASQVAMIAGPALGGFLYVLGPGAVYGASALLYLAAIAAMTMLRYDHVPPRREPATLRTVFAGVSFIRARPVVFGVISLDLFAVLLGGATALLPIFARDILHTGPWGLACCARRRLLAHSRCRSCSRGMRCRTGLVRSCLLRSPRSGLRRSCSPSPRRCGCRSPHCSRSARSTWSAW